MQLHNCFRPPCIRRRLYNAGKFHLNHRSMLSSRPLPHPPFHRQPRSGQLPLQGESTTSLKHPRRFSISTFPILPLPPLTFFTLLLTLWLYKSLMLILFQSKILFMPSIPPFSRSEKNHRLRCAVPARVWREERITAGDGVEVAVAVGGVVGGNGEGDGARRRAEAGRRRVLVLFHSPAIAHPNPPQSNGSSLPPRFPALSSILKSLPTNPSHSPTYALLALSYRGYWTSRGRFSQPFLEHHAASLLNHIRKAVVEVMKGVGDGAVRER